MTPGGTTELIWHFAGYIHLAEDYARDIVIYEDGPSRRSVEDYATARSDESGGWDLDPFSTLRSRIPQTEPLADFVSVHLPVLKALKVSFPPPPRFESSDWAEKLEPRQAAPAGGGGAGEMEPRITVTYGDGACQIQFEAGQINRMIDDDHLLVGGSGAVMELRPAGILATLQDMANEAFDQVPAAIDFPQTTAEIIGFLTTHDEAAAADEQHDGNSIEPGRYVNGELDEAEPAPDPPPPPEAAPDLGTTPGQWSMVGENLDVNAALIVDVNESARTMVVLGDYFKINAFVQTNSLMDDDVIEIGGSVGGNIGVGGNTADNIATFAQFPGLYIELPARFAGPNWHVDVVNGNFYDIHLVVQRNFLSDNDVIVQDSQDIHYEVHAGENDQLNLTQIFSGEIKYDLIIIAGSYHGANVIFQHNILLDPDMIKIAGAGGTGPAQSIMAGQNELLNNAAIHVYGDDNFLDWDPQLSDLTAAIAAGAGDLDLLYGDLIAGNGGTLNVLYVTGDYFDINAIWQVNMIADADVALQIIQDPAGYQLPGSSPADGPPIQVVTSGGNQLTNDAAIIDVGSTEAFVNGDVYTDTIMIQAKLVDDDNDHVTFNDTDALVSEIIAFADSGENGETPPQALSFLPQDDPMANVLT